jgi:hypothetical protein
MSIERPELVVVGDVYQFIWPVTGIEMTMDRIQEAKDGIQTEITIARTLGGGSGLLHYARLNLLSTVTRGQLVKTLHARADDIDWTGALEQACLLAVSRYRTGEPVIDLREVNLNSTHPLADPPLRRGCGRHRALRRWGEPANHSLGSRSA